jgi:spermidine/putrescine-binding protein
LKRFVPILITAALTACIFLGCGGGGENGKVNVYNWGEYIDEDILAQFEEDTGYRRQLQDL